MFGEAGVNAVKKEMQQFHDRNVMQVINPTKLTHKQKKEALAYLMFLIEKLSANLKESGFTMNTHDSCVVNKIINRNANYHSLACGWPQSLALCQAFNHEFGKEILITQFSMTDYIKFILQDVPDDMARTAATPVGNYLFRVNKTSLTMLVKDKKDIFVHISMQMLYLSQRVQPDTAALFQWSSICVEPWTYHWSWKVIKQAKWNSGWMHHMHCIPTWKDIQVEQCHWEVGPYTAHHLSRGSSPSLCKGNNSTTYGTRLCILIQAVNTTGISEVRSVNVMAMGLTWIWLKKLMMLSLIQMVQAMLLLRCSKDDLLTSSGEG